MEHPPSSGPRLWNILPPVDQDNGAHSLQWTMIMEHTSPRLWNALPRADHNYGTPSLERPPSSGVRLWNAPPSSGPRLWNTLPRVHKNY